MIFSSNKQKGNSGLGMAIAYFSTNGYTVSIPLNDTQDYDLVVEKDNILQTNGTSKSNRMYRKRWKLSSSTEKLWWNKRNNI